MSARPSFVVDIGQADAQLQVLPHGSPHMSKATCTHNCRASTTPARYPYRKCRQLAIAQSWDIQLGTLALPTRKHAYTTIAGNDGLR